MWIQVIEDERDSFATQSLKHPEGTLGELVEFTSNKKAKVSKDVGEAMTDHWDIFEPTESADSESEESEETADTEDDNE